MEWNKVKINQNAIAGYTNDGQRTYVKITFLKGKYALLKNSQIWRHPNHWEKIISIGEDQNVWIFLQNAWGNFEKVSEMDGSKLKELFHQLPIDDVKNVPEKITNIEIEKISELYEDEINESVWEL